MKKIAGMSNVLFRMILWFGFDVFIYFKTVFKNPKSHRYVHIIKAPLCQIFCYAYWIEFSLSAL